MESRSHTDEGSDEIDFYLEKNDFFTWIWNLLFTSPFVGKRNPSKFRKTSKSIFFFESSCVIVTFKGTCYCLQELRSFDYR